MPQTARTTLLLSLGLTMVGSCGVMGSMSELEVDQNALRALEEPATADPIGRAAFDTQRAYLEVALSNPRRRPLAAGHLAVSALLVIASFMITLRRKSAFWFVRQVVLANILVIGAQCISDVVHVWARRDAFLPSLRALAETTGQSPTAAHGLLAGMAAFTIGFTVLRIALHAFLGWRITRADIREFVLNARS